MNDIPEVIISEAQKFAYVKRKEVLNSLDSLDKARLEYEILRKKCLNLTKELHDLSEFLQKHAPVSEDETWADNLDVPDIDSRYLQILSRQI